MNAPRILALVALALGVSGCKSHPPQGEKYGASEAKGRSDKKVRLEWPDWQQRTFAEIEGKTIGGCVRRVVADFRHEWLEVEIRLRNNFGEQMRVPLGDVVLTHGGKEHPIRAKTAAEHGDLWVQPFAESRPVVLAFDFPMGPAGFATLRLQNLRLVDGGKETMLRGTFEMPVPIPGPSDG